MRTMDCPGCGQHVEAQDDTELFAIARQHADDKHADQNLTDDQIRALIAQLAQDA